jgi:cellulose synthase/poly-beta-1,6-N-acetylglucosamine synthase-like glycosyltransferase
MTLHYRGVLADQTGTWPVGEQLPSRCADPPEAPRKNHPAPSQARERSLEHRAKSSALRLPVGHPSLNPFRRHPATDQFPDPSTKPHNRRRLSWKIVLIATSLLWLTVFGLTLAQAAPSPVPASVMSTVLAILLHFPYIIILTYMGFGLVERIGFRWHGKPPVVAGSLPATIPTVCVQLPMFNEAAVARRIIEAAAALDWPSDRLTIQVLDDSTDPAIQEMVRGICAEVRDRRGIACEWIHRTDRSGYKAGALEAGRHVTDAEFIAIFDADFVPLPDYLQKIIPHFYTEQGVPRREIALVQAQWGHLNDSQSMLTAAQALWVDDHHTLQQSWRSSAIGFVNFTGTAGTWRASAIEAIGGWRSASLVEDCELSIRALFHGYQTRFVKEVVAPAELPQTIADYRLQQKRWTQGWVQLQRMHFPTLLMHFPCRLKVKAYLIYFATISWQWPVWALWVTLFPFLIAFGLWAGAFGFWPGIIVYVLPPLAFAIFAAAMASRETRQTYMVQAQGELKGRARRFWRVIPYLVVNAGMLPHHLCAFLEGMFGPMHSEFERTPKTAATVSSVSDNTAPIAVTNSSQACKSITRPAYFATEMFFVVTQASWIAYFVTSANYPSAFWAYMLMVCILGIGILPMLIPYLRSVMARPARGEI